MANSQVPAGVDYSQYANWERVVAPSGQVYYKVPDTGWLYDPFTSSQTGRPQLFQDPRPQVAERERQREQQERLIDQQEYAQSPMGQLTPVVGSAAGLVGANYLVDAVKAPTAVSALQNGTVLMSDGTIKGAQALANVGSQVPAVAPASFEAGLQSSLNYSPVGNTFDALNAPVEDFGGLNTFAGSATPYLGAAGTALGAYNAFQGIKDRDPLGAGLGGLGMGLGLNMMGIGLGPIGWGAMLAAPAAMAFFGDELSGDKDMWRTEEKRLNKLREQGYNIPVNPNPLKQGQSHEQLIAAAEASGDQKTIDFARSRNEMDLTPGQFVNNASVYERVGKDGSDADRIAAAQDAYNAQQAGFNVLREHHGTIDIDWAGVDSWKKQEAEKGGGTAQNTPATQPPMVTGTNGGPAPQVNGVPRGTVPVAVVQESPEQKIAKELARRADERNRRR